MKGFESANEHEMVCVLFDMLLYRHTGLNSAAFKLLINYFTRKHSLIEQLSNVQLLDDPASIKVLGKATLLRDELKMYLDDLDSWINL